MAIDVSMVNDTNHDHSSPLISLPIYLSQYLPEEVYVGFSGSTGNLTQLNCIISWNFTGQNIERRNGFRLIWILLVILLSICICCGFTCYLWWRRMRITNSQGSQATLNLESMLENSTSGPHKFQFKELRSATANFYPNNKLGQGGFGPVYKGFLQKTSKEAAIKRVLKDSRQGEQEFIAEVMTISCLRHKNLVKLIGWCYERGELLMVYEILPRGSLDKLLFSNVNSKPEEVILSWDKRYKIICGVASALSYLHDGCERRVLHRDVKASNVMIDSEYNAQLGDFGLARMVQHEGKTHHSTNAIAGTPSYIAAKCFHTSKASVETDVYGFGVFSMEVVCGQRPSSNLWNRNTHLVDWVWDLYSRRRVLLTVWILSCKEGSMRRKLAVYFSWDWVVAIRILTRGPP
ncbi:probable L-type lectin-domain containing receptor kinase S.5 [Magnolia sinica]|uniref:probable L-type lectin-domain containing receptor kinase S.5 n=1 Tax=Magnolia sinica TaxID=86752 RepID=UPI002658CF93|nr:probable L-type lectin-domain containing receptor kinase S.5 [Magnolia sinica]